MNQSFENPTDFDQLEDVKRFFCLWIVWHWRSYPALDLCPVSDEVLRVSFRGPQERHVQSAYSVRHWKDVVPQLGDGDFVFLTQGGSPSLMEALANQGVRHAQPFNIVSDYQTYETPTFLHFCRTYLKGKRGIALDIGGNAGMTGAMLATYCHHVHIFEANPEMERVIYDMIAGNSNITVHMKAASRSSGKITMYPAEQNNMSAVVKDKSNPISVPCVSIDEFCLESKVAPTAIKIDVEGVEAQVIFGAAKTIEMYRPHIFFEHPLFNAGSYDTDLDCARESLQFLNRIYDLIAYPSMDQFFPAEAMGAPLSTFQDRFVHLPVNVAAIPRI